MNTIHDILAYLSRSANPFEWLMALVGIFTSSIALRILMRSRQRRRDWLSAGLNGTVLKQINGNIEVAMFNLSFQLLAAAWGITLMLTLPAAGRPAVTATGIVNALVVVMFELLMAVKLVRLNRRQVKIAAEISEREAMGFTGPIPVVGFDAQITAARRLIEAALSQQEAAAAMASVATEMGNAAVQMLSIMHGAQTREARKVAQERRGNQADQYAHEGEMQ